MKLQRNVADFIEENCAAIGELKAAYFLADSASEGSAFVAEKFTFEQPGRNGSTIYFHERAFAART